VTENIFALEHPETDRRRDGGFTLWFTGLSGAGKTTVAHLVGPAIEERGPIVEYLDGDTVRTHLSKGLGFSKEDRDANIERIGWVSARLARHGAAVLASAISPYAEARQHARELVEQFGEFVEVFVDVSLEEARRRDTKGLYEKAIRGEIKGFTGVDDPYESPVSPDVRIDSDSESPQGSAERIVSLLEERGLIPAAVRV
jgi:adenylylsulfate kinase